MAIEDLTVALVVSGSALVVGCAVAVVLARRERREIAELRARRGAADAAAMPPRRPDPDVSSALHGRMVGERPPNQE